MTLRIFIPATCLAGALYGQNGERTIAFQHFAASTLAGPVVAGFGGVGGKIVTGKPVSALEERHTLQVLADGTRIERTETDKFFRDNEGRTRIEEDGGKVIVSDPISGFTAELNSADKTARKMMVRMVVNGAPVTADPAVLAKFKAEMAAGKATAEARQIVIARTEAGPFSTTAEAGAERVKVRHILLKTDGSNDAEVKSKAETVLELIRLGADFAKLALQNSEDPASKANGGELGWIAKGQTVPEFEKAAFSLAVGQTSGVVRTPYGYHIMQVEAHDGATEDLGGQILNGVHVQGTRSTITIPVGQIGNDREIKVVSEHWFSDDLQMLVKSSNSDPRFGDTTYQLTNVAQGTQDPALFQIPADFTVK